MCVQQSKEEEVTEVVKPQKEDYQPGDWAVTEAVGATAEVADVSVLLSLRILSSM